MRSNRLVVEVLTQFIDRIEALENKQDQVDSGLGDVDKQVKRLAKEIYKSNLMNDSAADEHSQDLIHEIRETYSKSQDEAITQARLEIAKGFLPIIDSVEAGLRSGAKQIKQLQATQPEAARILYTWLNGQRLLRERLLKLLETENVYPMQALGEVFDPYRHVAIKVVTVNDKASDTIIKVERAGYIHDDYVLRFADVVVNKSNKVTT